MNVRFSISPENSETSEKSVCEGEKAEASTHASPPHTHRRRVRTETKMSYASRDVGKQNHQTLTGVMENALEMGGSFLRSYT